MGFWNNGGFFSSVKGHVFKWWQLVIMPVLRINNNGRKNQQTSFQQDVSRTGPGTNVTQNNIPTDQMRETQQMISQPTVIESSKQATEVESAVSKTQQSSQVTSRSETTQQKQDVQAQAAISTEDPMEVLRRINEEKEEKRRKEIEAAKKKASEEARIAAIMNANKVDVNAFIEAGKAAKEEIAARKADEQARREAAEEIAKGVQPATAVKETVDEALEKKRKQDEDLRRAQEIMDRLNREAAEDEAKKQAEIDAAKEEAKKHFG